MMATQLCRPRCFIAYLTWIVGCFLLLTGAAPAPRNILFLGDSITAGYGLETAQAYPALIQDKIDAKRWPFKVINAGQSGDTSAGGLGRMDWLLKNHIGVLVLELGGNDGLRGLPLRQVRENFQFLIERCKAAGAAVVLVGMRMPPNYGAAYADAFRALYGELAGQYGTPLVGFFLDGVALDDKLMQADGIHPTAAAQPRLLDNLWPALQKVLKK